MLRKKRNSARLCAGTAGKYEKYRPAGCEDEYAGLLYAGIDESYEITSVLQERVKLLCRAVLLDKEEIGPGESGYVQLRLEDEIAVRRGDKFVVRFLFSDGDDWGGVILEPNPGVKRRFQQDVIEELKRKESGSSADVIELHIKEHGDTMITSAELAKLTALSMDEVNQDIEELKENGQIYVFPMQKRYVYMACGFKTWSSTGDCEESGIL